MITRLASSLPAPAFAAQATGGTIFRDFTLGDVGLCVDALACGKGSNTAPNNASLTESTVSIGFYFVFLVIHA